jgi:cytochrome oxidase Cu insertion factor (SCO1/SenC/PrrC family)
MFGGSLIGPCFVTAAQAAGGVYAISGPWVDDRARPYELERLEGSYSVVTMAYGACRRVCSTSLRVMQQLQSAADERKVMLNFVVVGLDPGEDKPEDWAQFRVERKLARPNWQFLSGTSEATRRLARHLGVRYWRYGEHTMHDFQIVLLSPEGRVLRSMLTFDADPSTLLP